MSMASTLELEFTNVLVYPCMAALSTLDVASRLSAFPYAFALFPLLVFVRLRCLMSG